MELNLPWVESVFFEEELQKRSHLSNEEQQQARYYHENGYLVLKNFLKPGLVDELRSYLEENYQADAGQNRARDLWRSSPAVKELAVDKKVQAKLKMLYDRQPIPFQTLNFKHGSQQSPHSDSLHFHSFPERFMCGVWVALEDVDESNGTLVYYPGSHKMNTYNLHALSKDFYPAPEAYTKKYAPFIEKLMEEEGLFPEYFRARKGDLIIWSANLIHGGLPFKDSNRTRWSQVTHYFFEDCVYYNPRESNAVAGEWSMDKITDIRTGQRL